MTTSGFPLDAVTFDFWNTLVQENIARTGQDSRAARMRELIQGLGEERTDEQIREAIRRGIERYSEAIKADYRELGLAGRWALIAEELSLPPDLVPVEAVDAIYDTVYVANPPQLTPGIREAILAVKGMGLKVAVICNTGMAGGIILRKVLVHHGLLDLFDVTTWSDEHGWAKPHPTIFDDTLGRLGGISSSRALHIGDLEYLDVDGAYNAGMFSALYAPKADAGVETRAHVIVRDWADFAAQLRQLPSSR